MKQGRPLQEPFLNALRLEQVPVSIFLVSGIKLQGTVESFDQYVLLLKGSVSQLIYKHAIASIVPVRNVRLPQEPEPQESGSRESGPQESGPRAPEPEEAS